MHRGDMRLAKKLMSMLNDCFSNVTNAIRLIVVLFKECGSPDRVIPTFFFSNENRSFLPSIIETILYLKIEIIKNMVPKNISKFQSEFE